MLGRGESNLCAATHPDCSFPEVWKRWLRWNWVTAAAGQQRKCTCWDRGGLRVRALGGAVVLRQQMRVRQKEHIPALGSLPCYLALCALALLGGKQACVLVDAVGKGVGRSGNLSC